VTRKTLNTKADTGHLPKTHTNTVRIHLKIYPFLLIPSHPQVTQFLGVIIQLQRISQHNAQELTKFM
jgi:hypothetical protein